MKNNPTIADIEASIAEGLLVIERARETVAALVVNEADLALIPVDGRTCHCGVKIITDPFVRRGSIVKLPYVPDWDWRPRFERIVP